ncbi:EAL domain-containing protein [Oceanospirillum sediminis]|nr:EAL domain-containing protein [Oceanospirillum sediminis]
MFNVFLSGMKSSGYSDSVAHGIYLRVCLLGGLALSGILGIIAISSFMLWQSMQDSIYDSKHQGYELTRDFFQSLEADLNRLADFVSVTEDIDELLLTYMGRDRAMMSLSLVDADGHVRFQQPSSGEHKADFYPQQPWLSQVRSGQTFFQTYQRHKQPLPGLRMAISVPDNKGKFRQTLLAEADLSLLWADLGRIRVGEQGHTFLAATDGRILLHRKLNYTLKQQSLQTLFSVESGDLQHSGIQLVEDIHGSYGLLSVSPFKQGQWLLVVFQPLKDFQIWFVLSLAIVLISLTMIAGLVISTGQFTRLHLMRPLRQLLTSVQHFEQGDFDYRGQYPDKSELHHLGYTLDNMASRLGKTLADLHDRLEDLKLSQNAVQVSQRRYQDILHAVHEIIFQTDDKGRWDFLNPAWYELTGHRCEESMGSQVKQYICPEDVSVFYENYMSLVKGDVKHCHTEIRVQHASGSICWLEVFAKVRLDEKGNIIGTAGTMIDISDRKHAEEQSRLISQVYTHAREGILITDLTGSIVDVNDAFSLITGYDKDDVLGRNIRSVKTGLGLAENQGSDIWSELHSQGFWSGELWNQKKNGDSYAELLTISAVDDDQSNSGHYVALFSDITEQKRYQQQLEMIAHNDALTGLPNRLSLSDFLYKAMAETEKHRHRLAVVYLDLDGFKEINDVCGHDKGDLLLKELSSRMQQSVKDGDMLARLGGDEFVAVLRGFQETDDAIAILKRLLAAASAPVYVDDLEMQVSASLGVSFFPQDEHLDADQLLRQADQAMYKAKVAGKNRYYLFDAAKDKADRDVNLFLAEIRQALNNDEFVLFYQPRVNMQSGAVKGAEALIRWQHPEKGLLAPGYFLPAIEDHSLSVELDRWVLRTALKQIVKWQQLSTPLRVSVNIGVRYIQQKDFVTQIKQFLDDFPEVDPSSLEIEVLESNALKDISHVSEVITECQQLGILFALDDFGTGYSTLTYLKKLPADILKIDRSFVSDLLYAPDNLSILEGIMGLAGAFGRSVIAEGVETDEQGELLIQLGCEQGQGYGIARPLPEDQFLEWLDNWRPAERWLQARDVCSDKVPVLMAMVEHRAWIRQLEHCIEDEGYQVPVMDHLNCRFARWLKDEGDNVIKNSALRKLVHRQHQIVHETGNYVLDLRTQGQYLLAQKELVGLSEDRERLLETLQKLLHDDNDAPVQPALVDNFFC